MANKKISDLTAKTSVSSGDLLPLVDTDGTYETKHTTFQQVLDYVTGSGFTSLTASYVSGTQARFTSLTGNLEGDITGNAATVTNGAYLNTENTFTDNNVFTTITASSIDVDTITAREYYTELVTASVIYESGSTKFGNTSDDVHQFTGSVLVDGDVSGSTAKFTNLSGNLDWSYVINEPTFLEANQTITLSGDASGTGTTSIAVSDVTASYVDWADVDNAPTFLEGNETITLSGDATGSGTTSIAIGDVTASFIKAGTDGSNLTSLTASQLSNFTSDVRGQFVAGDNIIINGGEISASLAAAGDVFLAGNNVFTAANTFNNYYVTASAGISGSNAIFDYVTSSYFYSNDNNNKFIFTSDHTSSVNEPAFMFWGSTTGDANSVLAVTTEGTDPENGTTLLEVKKWYVGTRAEYRIDNTSKFTWGYIGDWNKSGFGVYGLGNTENPGARIGTTRESTGSLYVAAAVSRKLGYQDNDILQSPIDIVKFYSNGIIHLSGTYARLVTSGSNDLELSPGGTGVVKFNDSYSFPTSDGTIGQVLTTDGNGVLTFETPAVGTGDVLSGSDNTFTAVNTFNNHYITASAGITGADANFSTITASAEVKVGAIKINGDFGNVAIGSDAHISNIIGQRNVAIGSNALENNTTNSNIGIGAWALRYNTTGRGNVALGDSALRDNVDSWNNVAVGTAALLNLSGSNSETTQNTAIGSNSLYASVTGSKNTAVGYNSLVSNVYGSNNVAIGHSAGSDVVTGSNNIFIGYDAATGETSLENTVIIRTDQDVMRIDDAGQLSASSFVGDGSSLTNLTASQISDFTNDVRGQFTAGTNITIVNGEISSTAAGTGDVLSGSDNTFTAVNTFDNHYITASVGVSGSSAIFDSITSSLFYNPQPTYFDSGVTNSSTNFTFRGTSSTTGRLLSVFKNTSEVFYVRYDGIIYASSQLTVANELNLNRTSIDGQSTGIWRTAGKPAHFVASGSTSIPAVRVGTKNNDDAEKIFAVSKDLYDPNESSDLPVDVLEILGDGTITLSGSSTKITTSASSDLELAPGGTGAVRFNEEYKFPTADGVDGQVLTTDGLGNLTFQTPTGTGDVSTSGNNTLTGINTFNTYYITASEGITGGDAKFTSLSGNIDWAYVVGEPTDLSGYGITDAVDLTSTQTITGQKTFSDQNNEFTGSFIASNIIEKAPDLGIPMSGNVDINGSIVADIEIPAEITSTSYTVDLSDRGRTLLFNNTVTQEITCSAGLNTGFTCTFIQMGAGQLILTASSGATLLNRQDHTGSAGQYAAVSIVVVGSNQYLIAGDTV